MACQTLSLKGGWRGGQRCETGGISEERGKRVEESEANEMCFTDKGRHGERRETSQDFNVTTFHKDNSASAVHTHSHTHPCAALMAEGQGRVERCLLLHHTVNGGGCRHYNPLMLI